MSLADITAKSAVHQILLSKGEIDRVPVAKIEDIKSAMPGTHTLWLEPDIKELLSNNFGPEVLAAFEKIKPLAYKADLARYCILYALGGWYFDLTTQILDPSLLSRYSEDFQVIIFRDVPSSGDIAAVGNTVMWFKHSGHKILMEAINSTTKNIMSENYSHHQHGITGPIVLGRAVAEHQKIHSASNILVGDTIMLENHPTHIFNDPLEPNFLAFSRRRAMHENLSAIMPTGYEATSNYWKMYNDREVY
jgi:mannosyltransferase OCH1-like enzyme